VFAGRPTPYTEIDHPDPIIDYGRAKLDAERAVTEVVPGAAIVRTSLLYGSEHLSPFQVELRAALQSGSSPMTFFIDEFRAPAHAADVAAAISTLAADRDSGGVLHVAGPDRLSRLELAQAMAAHLGYGRVTLATSTIAESGMTRPGDVVLDSSLAASRGITCRSIRDALR